LLRIDAAMLAQAITAGLRDPNDLPILALLIGSAADHLVTGDKDMLALADAYPILTPAKFVDRFLQSVDPPATRLRATSARRKHESTKEFSRSTQKRKVRKYAEYLSDLVSWGG
jgi:hypothetical protein